MQYLVAVVLTRNEAHNIEACIMSLRTWVDGVVVWDSGSVDDTVVRAQRAGALVVARPFDNYPAQRQAVLDTIDAQWILFVDADERATPALAREVREVIGGEWVERVQEGGQDDKVQEQSGENGGELTVGYWIPRRNLIVGHAMRGGGFTPDYQLRLLKRGRARYVAEREVHEIVTLTGAEGTLRAPLVHYNYLTWDQFHRKQRIYATYEARILASRGIRPRAHNYIMQPLREFRRRFFTLGGWRDGQFGLRLALWLAWYYGFMPYRLLTQVPPAV